MSNEIITGAIGLLGGGAAFWGAVKAGLIKVQIGGNGNGIKAKLDEIEGNHLHSIEGKIDKLIELMEKHNDQHLEALLILRRLEK